MQHQMTTNSSNNDSAAVASEEHLDKRHKTDSEVCSPVPF
jgi:hypothetical protein